MIALSTINKGTRSDGKQIVHAVIRSDDIPTELPTTGSGITGLSVDDCFAPLSILFADDGTVTKVYIADDNGNFVEYNN